VSALPLANRVIVVTGATGGLGRVAALSLAKAGATVVLVARKIPKLETLYDELEASGAPQPALYPLDLAGASLADYAEMARSIEESLGRIDGVFHAAAELGALKPFQDIGGADWQRILHVNLTAPIFMTQAFLPALKASQNAQIVFVDDSAAGDGKPFWHAYGAAKAGLRHFAESLDAELQGFGVRTTCFVPGPIRTSLRLKAFPGESLDQLVPAESCSARLLALFTSNLHSLPTSSDR